MKLSARDYYEKANKLQREANEAGEKFHKVMVEGRKRATEHVCGAQGFGRGRPGEPPDICPACSPERAHIEQKVALNAARQSHNAPENYHDLTVREKDAPLYKTPPVLKQPGFTDEELRCIELAIGAFFTSETSEFIMSTLRRRA